MERPEEFCPHCGADIIGDEIPVEIRHHYKSPYYWRRKIGITDLELDRITHGNVLIATIYGRTKNRNSERSYACVLHLKLIYLAKGTVV
jgi:hypothetical protein